MGEENTAKDRRMGVPAADASRHVVKMLVITLPKDMKKTGHGSKYYPQEKFCPPEVTVQ